MQAESSAMGAEEVRTLRPRKKLKPYSSYAEDKEEKSNPTHTKPIKSAKKAKVGKLSGLLTMPLDILFEIFGHLRPLDLLRLARMTKEFRRVLMHRSSLSVWKAARANVPGHPDIPPDLSEPHWANLAFDPHCHFCFTTGVRSVEWRLRVRICAKCAKQFIHESWGVRHLFFDFDSDNEAVDDVEHLTTEPLYETMIPTRPGKRRHYAFLLSDYDAVKAKYHSIDDADAREVFVQERKALVKEIERHAILCEEWAKGQTQDRSKELQEIRDNRKQGIIEKLTALGYGKDIDSIQYPDSFEDHKLVKQPQRLTERIWNNIKDPMIEFMEEMKVKRLTRELAALILQRKRIAIDVLRQYKNSQLPYTEIMPEAVDFCDFPLVKAVLDQPADIDIDESSFAEIVPLLPDLIEKWRADIHQQLIWKMKANDDEEWRATRLGTFMMLLDDEDIGLPEMSPILDDDKTAEQLKLATTVFKCHACPTATTISDPFYSDSDDDEFLVFQPTCVMPLFYPKVLGHRCLTRLRHRWTYETNSDPSKALIFDVRDRKKWACCSLRLDTYTGKVVRQIVDALDLDPTTTTAEDMDQLDPRFGCLSCPETSDQVGCVKVSAFGWRSAVKHQIENHFREAEWCILTPPQVEQARLLEQTSVTSSDDDGNLPLDMVVWLCVHCRDLPSEKLPTSLGKVRSHIKEKHDVSEPELNKDYYKDFAAPQGYGTLIPFQTSKVHIPLDMVTE